MVDIKTLEKLAERIEADAKVVHALNPSAMLSIADIIRASIGAPLMWPSRIAGADYAEDSYRGSPDLRAAFNHGVKWAVEHYSPTVKVEAADT